jgi:two-component system, OmpR family, response regulator
VLIGIVAVSAPAVPLVDAAVVLLSVAVGLALGELILRRYRIRRLRLVSARHHAVAHGKTPPTVELEPFSCRSEVWSLSTWRRILGSEVWLARCPEVIVAPMRVLIADDDRQLGPVLVRGLAGDRVGADLVASAKRQSSARPRPTTPRSSLELNLPDLDGFQVCRTIRQRKVDAPILILSSRTSIKDRVQGLEVARTTTSSSRSRSASSLPASVPSAAAARFSARSCRAQAIRGWTPRATRCTGGDTPIDLSRKEFAMLETFMQEPARVLSRTHLLEHGWGYQHEIRSNVVEVYVGCLRGKIDRPYGRKSLQTVRGVGYRLCGDE